MYKQRQPEPRKSPSGRSRQSKRLVFRRSMVLMAVFGLGLFIPLLIQLWNIAIVHHDEYQTKAIEQQLMDVTVSGQPGRDPGRQRGRDGHVRHRIQPDPGPQGPGKQRQQEQI